MIKEDLKIHLKRHKKNRQRIFELEKELDLKRMKSLIF